MTFSYNGSIPNPPNDPASDVGTMQTNATSIGSIIAVDHVGFNVAGGGQHAQVTFNANNVPSSFPVSPPVLFTNTVAALPQLFFYSGTAAKSSNQYYNSANAGNAVQGSAVLLGGLIIKWGTFTITNNNLSQTITYNNGSGNTPFPNSCFSAVVTCSSYNSANGNGDIWAVCTTFNASQLVVQRINQGNITNGANYNFISLGN